jgi:glutamate---cysteine ligase / carboxylate-amine ligase
MLEHRFAGPPFTIGVEEELMLVDAETLDLGQGIEAILDGVPDSLEGQVKPELFQSVLEVATMPCRTVGEATAELRDLRRCVSEVAERNGYLVGAAGTHPFALAEEQRIVDRERYRELAAELGWIARQELIFGTHVHVAIDGADKAIYVADGIRRYLPLLLALSSNSPYWRGERTGMMSARTAVFRAFPRVGVPPHYGNWEIYSRRVETMMDAGAIEDYTYMWWDVRPHPNLGTVETRVFDQQTRLDATASLAAITHALARGLARQFEDGEVLVEVPTELVDDNKVRAALRGLEGDLVDFPHRRVVPAPEMLRDLIAQLREDAQELGCEAELDGIEELIARGTGARRQLEMVDSGTDLRGLVSEIVEASRV